MKKDINVLLALILLIYKESLTNNEISSNDVIVELVELIRNSRRGYDEATEGVKDNLIDYIISIKDESQDIATILLSVRNMVDDDAFIIFKSSLEKKYESESELIKDVGNLLNFINDHYITKKATILFNKAGMDLKANRTGSISAKLYLQEVISSLEEVAMSKGGDIDGITSTVDFGTDALGEVVDDMKKVVEGGNTYKTGWQQMNEMFQGGLRPGEYYNLSALSYNNKTGIFDSIITAVLHYNKPINPTEGKKPTMVVFKTEDSLSKTFAYMFKILKMTETGLDVNIKDFTTEEIKEYLKKGLLRNGWHVIFHNTNPSELTYRSVMKRVYDLEALGHEVKFVGIDYLTKMSTVGCNMGPHGTDKRDLVKRLMTFFKARECTIMSPSQTNTAANNLLEENIEPAELPKVIAERGMYADSRQLHQEFDLSTQQQKFVKGGRSFLAIMREKHRTVTEILPEDKKYLILPFPISGPIPMDLDKPKPIGFRNMDQLNRSLANANSLIK